MKTLALVFLLVAPPATSPETKSGWIITEEIVIADDQGETRTITQTTEITQDAVRRSNSEASHVIVVDASAKDVPFLVVDPTSKTWFGFDASTIAATDMASPLMEGIAVDSKGAPLALAQPFITTDERDKVGGREVRAYHTSQPGPVGESVTWWVAEKPNGLPNQAMTSILNRVFARPGSQWTKYFTGLAGVRGYPVKSVTRIEHSGVTITATVVEIRKSEIPASAFRPPAGFKREADPIGVLPTKE